jgi:hypothetical protein
MIHNDHLHMDDSYRLRHQTPCATKETDSPLEQTLVSVTGSAAAVAA